jgi:hypothetical protein
MAISISTVLGSGSSKTIINTDVSDISLANNGAITLQAIEIDNGSNTSATYIHFYNVNATTSVTAGTTAPTMVLPCPESAKIDYVFPQGLTFNTGIVLIGSSNFEAVTYTTTAPSNAVSVKMILG